jgi:hypothetical protein
MKRFLIFYVIISFTSCSENSNFLLPAKKQQFRKIAYDSLSDEEKSTLIADWKDAEVKQGNYLFENNINWFVFDSDNKAGFALQNSDIVLTNNQELILVIFNTNVDALLGPIEIVINPINKEIIGGFLRL